MTKRGLSHQARRRARCAWRLVNVETDFRKKTGQSARGFTRFTFIERPSGFVLAGICSTRTQPTAVDHNGYSRHLGVNDEKIFGGICKLGSDRTLNPIISRASSTENGE